MSQFTDAEPHQPGPGRGDARERVVVVTPEGMAVTGHTGEGDRSPAELIEEPAKVMRIGSMIKQLLEEVRTAPLDEAGRARLAAVHERSIAELEQGLAPELSMNCTGSRCPSRRTPRRPTPS
jgi:hypothetical protein